MPSVRLTITRECARLLGSAKGATMVALEAAIVARDNMAWGAVRVHLTGTTVDVSVALRDLPVNSEGDVEEFGVLEVSEAGPGPLVVEGISKEARRCAIGKTVTGVTLVNDRVTTFDAGQEALTRDFTQAVVFSFAGGDSLVLDKGPWFSEMIAIGMGASWEDLVYDSSQDWEDDPEEPDVRHAWERTLERI